MENKKKKERTDKVGFGTLLIWCSRNISQTVFTLMYTFLMIYCTDTLQISPMLVSGILLGSKLVDGVTDMVAGFLVDRTKTKWGKARPYEIFIIGYAFCTWLLFSCPDSWSTTVKCVWVFFLYTMANAICMTFLNANGTPYLVRAFKNEQIVKITSYGSVFPMLTGFVFNITFPMLMQKIATSAAGWSRLVLMWAIPATAIGLLRVIFIKEKYEVESKEMQQEPLKAYHVLKLIKTNKYILLLVLMTLIFNFVTNMGAVTYYYTYIVKNVGLMGIASAITIIALPLAFVFPKLISLFSTGKLIIAGLFVTAAGYLLNFFAGSNMVMLMIGQLLTGAGTVPVSMLISLCVIDCAEFNEWKGNHRMEGTMSSLVGLGGKVGAAVGGSVLGVFLSLAGYTGVMETMPSSAFTMIRLLFSLIPMVLFLITGISMLAYLKMEKNLPEIKEENKLRHMQEEK